MIITLRKIRLKIVLQILLLIPIFASANLNAESHFSENFQSEDTEAPTAPKNATSPGSIVSTADISWTASTDNIGVKSYEIYRNNVLIGSVDAPTTTYRATGLAELTTYIFTIKAKDAAGNISVASNEVIIKTPDRTAPTIPANFTASEITGTSVKLSWGSSTDNVGVVGYNIYSSSTLLKQVDASTTTYTAGLSQNFTSRFSIRARDAIGNLSFWSNEILVKPLDIVPPTVPRNLVASEITTTSIKLSWTASTDTESAVSYEIYKGGNTLVGTSSTDSFTITGLNPNNAYLFSVKAKDASGNYSDASLALLAETLDTIAPTAPGSLTASELTTTSVNLNWSQSTDNREVIEYQIYTENSLPWTSKVLNLKITSLVPNTTYTFYVKAKDAAGNLSASSNTITIKTDPAPPTYCVSQGYSQVYDEFIKRVQIGTIDKKSNVSSISYTDATNLSTELKKGETYSIIITPNEWISGKTQFSQRYAVWIDYNGDMDFYDSGELVFNPETTTMSPVKGTFVVPANAITGKTRIRVTLRESGVGIPSPCGDYTDTYNYGETEDYTANITDNPLDANAPEVPTNLTASGTTWTTTNLSWTVPANNADITGYEIYRENILIGTSVTNTFNVTGLRQGNTYLFTVKAKNANGLLSKSSVPVSVTTPKDNTSPTAPTNLRATTVTASKITISWDSSTNNGGGISYLIYYGETLLTTITNTNATITELGNNITYNFSVQAVDELGFKSEKTSISVTTLKDITPPTVAPQLIASETTSTTTNLSWTAAIDDEFITYYDIYNGSTLLYSVRGNVFQYNVSGLKEGTNYSFTVIARDGGSNKISSNILSVTTVAIPKYCTTKATTDDGNEIYKLTLGSINNNASSFGAAGNYNDFTTQATSLNPGQEYTITLQTLRSVGSDKNGFAVWIDLNGDKDFDDEGELIWSKLDNSAPFTPIIGKFTLPVSAKIGRTRMRVSLKRNEIPKPCEEFIYGEIEDYSIDIKKPIIESEVPSTPTNLSVSNITKTSAILSWNESTDNIAVTGYDIYQGNTLIGSTNLTTFNVNGLSAETLYSYTLRAKDYAKNTSASSEPISFTTSSLSVNEHDSKIDQYILFPNPVIQKLFVQKPNNNDLLYKISSMNGQIVLQGNLKESSIEVSHLSSGIYLIELKDEEKTIIKKFIKR